MNVKKKERFKIPNAVFAIIVRKNNGIDEILLQKRQNTGFMDGYWCCAASGHAEDGETLINALIRETKEEINLDVKKEDVEFALLSYVNFKNTYNSIYNYVYFLIKDFSGVPKIMEPLKCSELKWFPLDKLPENIIPDRKISILEYFSGIHYNEIGWD